MIEKIYIYSDKIVINFYYCEDNREVNLQEFNEYLKNIDNIMDFMDSKDSYENYQKRLDLSLEDILNKYGLDDDVSF